MTLAEYCLHGGYVRVEVDSKDGNDVMLDIDKVEILPEDEARTEWTELNKALDAMRKQAEDFNADKAEFTIKRKDGWETFIGVRRIVDEDSEELPDMDDEECEEDD